MRRSSRKKQVFCDLCSKMRSTSPINVSINCHVNLNYYVTQLTILVKFTNLVTPIEIY